MLIAQNKTLQKGMHGLLIAFLGYLAAILIVDHQLFAMVLMGLLPLLYFLINKRVSIYLIIVIAFFYLENASTGWGMEGRSFEFYLSALIMGFFLMEVFTNRWSFHIPINDRVSLLIFLFYFFSFMAMVFSINPDRSLKNITILLQIPFYFICAEIFYRKKEMLKHFAVAMTILGVVISFFVLLNYFAFGQFYGYFIQLKGSFIQYPFLFHNANSMAYAILLCSQFPLYMLPNVQKKNLKILLYLILTVTSIAIFTTYSRTGSALLMLSFLIFFLRQRLNKRIVMYVFIGLIISFLSFSYFFKSAWYENYPKRYTREKIIGKFEIHRGSTWKMALEEFSNHPFLGVGQDVLIWELHDDYTLTHNTYINILAERGLFTFIPYILILIYFFRLSRRLETKGRSQHQHIFMALSGVLMVHYLFSLTGDFPNNKFIWVIFSILTAEKYRSLRHKSEGP